jgi:hypothetical protein
LVDRHLQAAGEQRRHLPAVGGDSPVMIC